MLIKWSPHSIPVHQASYLFCRGSCPSSDWNGLSAWVDLEPRLLPLHWVLLLKIGWAYAGMTTLPQKSLFFTHTESTVDWKTLPGRSVLCDDSQRQATSSCVPSISAHNLHSKPKVRKERGTYWGASPCSPHTDGASFHTHCISQSKTCNCLSTKSWSV